jgi:choline dehydrogenase-like flavoprotein
MIYVIGSGPAGVTAARALLEAGREVTMLDAGNELETERKKAVENLRLADPDLWHGERVAFLKKNVAPDAKGIGLKYLFGSDFPYRDVAQLATFARSGADTSPSLAKGGFSNVWGSAMLPYLQRDIERWPIRIDDLAPHYQAVLGAMNVSARTDDLAKTFPLYTDDAVPLRMSRQASALLTDLAKDQSRLDAAGIQFGASRLAVRTAASSQGPGCVYCGLCMYGCPYDLIFNAAFTVAELSTHPKFAYVPNVIVRKLTETAEGVRIAARTKGGAPLDDFAADRVYLACGVISSTQILLESLEAFDRPVTLADSCYFLLPMLRLRGTADVANESLHTLAQAFVEIFNPEICDRTVHLQIYTYNDLYNGAFKKMLGPLFPLARPAVQAALSRLLIFQGYLHSDLSPSIQLTLLRRTDGGRELRIEGQPISAQTKEILRRVKKLLRAHWSSFKSFPALPMMHIPAPGRGFHSGGTFPMSASPRQLESDVLGRPAGFSRVHVVDSTTLPSIPATTITLSVMANAHRIASRHDPS